MSEYDFIANGLATGSVANKLLKTGGNIGVLRPYCDNQGRAFITINGQAVATNADAPLNYDAWKEIDRVVEGVRKKALPFVGSLEAAGLMRNVPNGFAKRVVQSQIRSGDASAGLSMDALSQTQGERPVYETVYAPLVIAHSDFELTYRDIETARVGGEPIDTAQIEDATYAVSEKIENLHLGNVTTVKFGGQNLYGVKNDPNTLTKNNLTAPTASGWTAATTYSEFTTMVETLSVTNLARGPFKVYVARAWSKYLDTDYSTQYPNKTLRQRLLDNEMIGSIETVDNLTDSTWDVIMISPEQKHIRTISGMPITTVQWTTDGGLNYKFKVMGIKIPEIRADYNGKSGVMYGYKA